MDSAPPSGGGLPALSSGLTGPGSGSSSTLRGSGEGDVGTGTGAGTGTGDSDEVDEPDVSGPPKKKRRRQALSCTECKRRKIKCDRQQPCAPCTRRGEQSKCQWHVVEPAEKYVTRTEYDELKARFEQLETLVHRLVPSINASHIQHAPQLQSPSLHTHPQASHQPQHQSQHPQPSPSGTHFMAASPLSASTSTGVIGPPGTSRGDPAGPSDAGYPYPMSLDMMPATTSSPTSASYQHAQAAGGHIGMNTYPQHHGSMMPPQVGGVGVSGMPQGLGYTPYSPTTSQHQLSQTRSPSVGRMGLISPRQGQHPSPSIGSTPLSRPRGHGHTHSMSSVGSGGSPVMQPHNQIHHSPSVARPPAPLPPPPGGTIMTMSPLSAGGSGSFEQISAERGRVEGDVGGVLSAQQSKNWEAQTFKDMLGERLRGEVKVSSCREDLAFRVVDMKENLRDLAPETVWRGGIRCRTGSGRMSL